MELPDDTLPVKFREQKAEIEQVIPVSVGTVPGDPSTPSCLYEAGIVLIHDEDDHLVPLVNARSVAGSRNRTGYSRFAVDDGPEVVSRCATAGRGMSRNHVVSITRVNSCPADEPAPVPAERPLAPPAGEDDAGRGVRIRVLDTGLIELVGSSAPGPVVPALANPGAEVARPGPAALLGDPDREFDRDGRIRLYAGHGSFIRGVLTRVAPAATVTVTAELSWAGLVTEHDLGDALERVLDEDPPDIISLSAGTETITGDSLTALGSFLRKLRAQDKTLLVAAAGNNGRENRFYPAGEADPFPGDAPPRVIAVGALRQDLRGRACFSNYGDWVTVYAPGERLVNAYYRAGRYSYRHTTTTTCSYRYLYPDCTCVAPPHRAGDRASFTGKAEWSGTSFSTPVVAGLIARHMARNSLSASQAALDLLRRFSDEITDAADNRPLRRLLPPGYPVPDDAAAGT